MAADPRLPLSHAHHTLGREGDFHVLLPAVMGMVEKLGRRQCR